MVYRQVRDVLVKRIVDGVWRPAETLPSKTTDIATDLRVSQGTVRKALNELAEENLSNAARQGERSLLAKTRHAFSSSSSTDPRQRNQRVPDSRILSVTVEPAEAEAALSLRTGSRVVASSSCDRWLIASAYLAYRAAARAPCFLLSRSTIAEQPLRTLALCLWRDGSLGTGKTGGHRGQA